MNYKFPGMKSYDEKVTYDHVYNSTLLFHKQTLISDYLAGKVPDFVALSIFALAAKYAVLLPSKRL